MLKLIRTETKVWELEHHELLGIGIQPTRKLVSVENGDTVATAELIAGALTDENILISVYAKDDTVVAGTAIQLTDPRAVESLAYFKTRVVVNPERKKYFLKAVQTKDAVRIIKNDPATAELLSVMSLLKLVVGMELNGDGKVNTKIRAFCRKHESKCEFAYTQNILKSIRTKPLPYQEFLKAEEAMTSVLDGGDEVVLT